MAALLRQACRSKFIRNFNLYPTVCSSSLDSQQGRTLQRQASRNHHEEAADSEETTLKVFNGQVWYNWNELGSTMTIRHYDRTNGVIRGTYHSAVGEAKKSYVMIGRIDTAGTTIGWTVNWQNDYLNAHSVTTWSGQQQMSSSGDVFILTTWLLTSQTTPDKNWESTLVGFDQFSQTPPPLEDKERARLRCCRSHPKEA